MASPKAQAWAFTGDVLWGARVHSCQCRVGRPSTRLHANQTASSGRGEPTCPIRRVGVASHSKGNRGVTGAGKPWQLTWDDIELISSEPSGCVEVLGMGRQQPVYKGRLVGSGEVVAVKTLEAVKNLPERHQSKVSQRLAAQLDTCHALRHENIVQYKGASTDLTEGMFIVNEVVEGINLRQALDKGKEEVRMDRKGMHLALCIARALEYLHTREPPVIHRDIKSSNILLSSDFSTAKLADIGYAFTGGSGQMEGSTSVQWSAPELWLAQQATPLSDIYSFGVVLWEILTGGSAWWLQEKVLRNRGLGLPDDTHPEIVHLVGNCLRVRPQERPSASEIVHTLSEITAPACAAGAHALA